MRLGQEVMMLSRAFRENLDITKIAVPVMREIANEVQELVYLAVPKVRICCIWRRFLRRTRGL